MDQNRQWQSEEDVRTSSSTAGKDPIEQLALNSKSSMENDREGAQLETGSSALVALHQGCRQIHRSDSGPPPSHVRRREKGVATA
uniref:Uncharacterized protein n=1 Tax=Cucumis sativus TaxID=3659 RepID=A0A0A0LJQ4_CUCSA